MTTPFVFIFRKRREIPLSETLISGRLPILALRGLAVFPDQTVHFDVGRLKSVKALEAAMKADQMLLLIPQKDLTVDDPTMADLYAMGTVAKVKQVLNSQDQHPGNAQLTGVANGLIGIQV